MLLLSIDFVCQYFILQIGSGSWIRSVWWQLFRTHGIYPHKKSNRKSANGQYRWRWRDTCRPLVSRSRPLCLFATGSALPSKAMKSATAFLGLCPNSILLHGHQKRHSFMSCQYMQNKFRFSAGEDLLTLVKWLCILCLIQGLISLWSVESQVTEI